MPPGTVIAKRVAVPSSVRAPGKITRVGDNPGQGRKWWLWPHLLSLDAPLVAVVWQGWWARSMGEPTSWAQAAILAGGVWFIYLADRLADTASTVPGGDETARHAFYRQHQPPMKILTAVIFLALSGLAPWTLDGRQFIAGLGLLAAVGGYFWLVHRRADGGWAHVLPKETLVAGMFTVGTMFFVLGRMEVPRLDMLLSGASFAGLCFLNCALITKWERKTSDLQDSASLLNAFPWLTGHLCAGCLCLALMMTILALAGPPSGSVALPMTASALLLALLDRLSNRLSVDAQRVLADATLLTPWLCRNHPFH